MEKRALYEISPLSAFYGSAWEPGPTPQPAARVAAAPRSHLPPTQPQQHHLASAVPSCLGTRVPASLPASLQPPSSASPPVLQEISVYSALFSLKHQKKSPPRHCQVEAGYAAARHRAMSPSAPGLPDFVGPELKVTAIDDPLVSPAGTCFPILERGAWKVRAKSDDEIARSYQELT